MARAAGPKAVAKNAAIGGVLLALIEGLTVLITKARKSRSASRALRARRRQTRASNPSRSSLAASQQWSAPTPLKKEDFEQDPTEPPVQPGLLPPIAMPTVEGVQDFFTSSDSQTNADNLSMAPMSAFDLSGNTPEEAPKARRGGLMGRLLGLGGK